jgi:hypothetical protein
MVPKFQLQYTSAFACKRRVALTCYKLRTKVFTGDKSGVIIEKLVGSKRKRDEVKKNTTYFTLS